MATVQASMQTPGQWLAIKTAMQKQLGIIARNAVRRVDK